MATDHIRYDVLTQEAMRGVIRSALQDAAARGLLGEHHFYITFNTRAPDVKLHQRIRAQYPEEMTIVLQHQFWDLIVTDAGFEVGLSFNGIRERLGIPFSAIKSFADPSVKFAMQFTELSEASAEDGAEPGAADAAPSLPEPEAPPAALPDIAVAPPDEKPSAEIVRIDRFRKK